MHAIRDARFRSGQGRALLTLGVYLAVMTSLAVPMPARAENPPPVPFELQPYRIRVSVAFVDSPTLDAEFRQTILNTVPVSADRLLGEMWAVTAEENRWLMPSTSEQLALMTTERLPTDWLAEAYDKAFLLTIEEVGGEYLLSGREWDQVGRVLGSMRSREVVQRSELPQAVFQLAHQLFRPLLTVEQVVSGVASVTVKAGALTPADPSCVQMKSKQYWQPFMRFRTSQGAIEKCVAVPWTMLQIQEISPRSAALGEARVISGLRSAMPTRRRSRMEIFARALEPTGNETVLRLVSRKNTSHPLVGVVVEASIKPDTPTIRFLTDRDGSVRIPIQKEEPLLWLYIRSGEKTLARLPLVPGLERQVQAELPDDSIRLRVEGELDILESTLTDTVAQRAVLIARIRKLVQFNDWKGVPDLKRDLRLLPGTDYYLKELNAIRIPSLKAAQAAKDKSTAAYIERVCGETSIVIQKYLDDDKLRAFEDELKELERAPAIKVKKASPEEVKK